MRKEKKRNKVITFTELEESQYYALECESNIDSFLDSISLKNEIEGLKRRLEEFNISLSEIVDESPKHKKVRIKTLNIATSIFENSSLKDELMRKKKLPITNITNELEVTNKALSRYRKFIIATVIILDSNLEMLKEYILEVRGGVTNDI